MKKSEELTKKLTYSRKNFWKQFKEENQVAFDYSEGYKAFLDACKTEREATRFYEKILKEKGFKEVSESTGGKKFYRTSREKNVAIAIKGNAPVSSGVNLIVSHIDAPRVDLSSLLLQKIVPQGLV